jgi:hypothetical protein
MKLRARWGLGAQFLAPLTGRGTAPDFAKTA